MSSFAGLTNVEKGVKIVADEVQQVETAAIQVLQEVTDFDIAVGAQLDIIGNIIGLQRQGLTDTDYRRRLKVQRLVNTSGGRANELIAIMELFLDGAAFVYEDEDDHFPAGFNFEVSDILAAGIGAQAALVLRSARGGGINGYITFHQSTPIFAFDGAGGAQFDSGGFGFRTALG